jgi:SnoaL-like domain
MGAGDIEEIDRAAFVGRFAEGWRKDAEDFMEHFLPRLVDEQVSLTQPLLPRAYGHDGFRALFEPLFAAIPDLRGQLVDWRPESDGVTIELLLRGTLDGLALQFTTRDRIVLRQGRMLSRHARFDVGPLLLALVRRPRTGLSLLLARRTR